MFFICSCGFTIAQNEMQQINAIKSNIDFLYATGTSSVSAEEASNNAKDLLALEIEMWLKERVTDDIAGYVAKSKENLSQIKTRRGNLFRVFAYVKKYDILPYQKTEDVMVVDFVPSQQQEVPDSAIVKPIQIDADSVIAMEPSYAPSETEKKMLAIKTFQELNDYVNKGREQEWITSVGNYASMPTTGTFYVFIHNKQREVPACLKVQDDKAINIKTGHEERVSDYKGCGAIWIKIKE